jgi:replicative DNA helicase|tara:strand:- start:1695 stop:3407 length:1713 start_codon:yes stop_codon:yes gene_type:complete
MSPVSETSLESKPWAKKRKPTIDASELFDRTPPHHIDAERSLLGSILLDPMVLTEIVEIISRPDQFYKEAHGTIFSCLLETFEAHQTGDMVQLAESLRAKGVFDQVGGSSYLMELAEAVPSAANAPYYAKLIADSYRLRKLIDAAGEILYEAYTQGGGAPGAAKDVVDQAEKRIFDIASEDINAEPDSLKELLMQEMIRIEEAEGQTITGLPTGFDYLDELLSGLQPEEMMILAARPSMGKTAIALNIAEQLAFGGSTPWNHKKDAVPVAVGVFSLEMSRNALTQRLLSSRSGVDSAKLRSGQVTDADWTKLQRASGELAEAQIIIDDTPGMTVLAMRAKARRMKQRHDIRCIVIDYLQLLTSPGSARESRQVEVSEISRSIKSLARELKVPIICLAQLNRGAEQREGNRPKMSDLRESGSIEQDADVVALLHRESYYHRGEPAWDPTNPEFDEDNREKLNMTELIIAKQRNGPTGTVKLVWDASTVRFKNWDPMHTSTGSQGFSVTHDMPDFNPNPQPPSPPPNGGFDGPDFAPPRQTFAPGSKSGPEVNFRDGSGNDVDFDDDDIPPF